MRKGSAVFTFMIIVSAAAGIFLSTVLIFEYYGISNAAADVVCSRGGTGVNNCTILSASRYAAISGIPVAAAGFVFYSFILTVFLMTLLQRKSIDTRPTIYLNGKLLTKESRKSDILEGLVQYCIKRGA